MPVSYSDWLEYYVSASMGCTHVMRNLQMYCYLCAGMQSYRGIVCALRSCIGEIDLVKLRIRIKCSRQVRNSNGMTLTIADRMEVMIAWIDLH